MNRKPLRKKRKAIVIRADEDEYAKLNALTRLLQTSQRDAVCYAIDVVLGADPTVTRLDAISLKLDTLLRSKT